MNNDHVDVDLEVAATERALAQFPEPAADAPEVVRRMWAEQVRSYARALVNGWADPKHRQAIMDAAPRAAAKAAAPATVSADAADADAPHLTDLGNARRLVRQHGADIRYCAPCGGWFVWDGRRWKCDETGEVMRRAKKTVLALYREAARITDGELHRSFVKHALRSQDEPRLRAMVALATSEAPIVVTADLWDRDPWALNVANGTLDLRTGTRRPHRREDYLTKLAPVTYDPAARSERWETFLHDTTGGNSELADFLQRYVGYTLTGSTAEEKLLLVLGPGSTGKSTLLEALKATLGDYAMTADFETFLKQPASGRPRNDLARLAGARLVISIEVEDGKALAEGVVKALTGGDTVAARLLYKEHFEYLPQFKLWLAANHAPRVRHDDSAMWRRILRAPFTHTVLKEDPQVKATLRDPSIAGPAILAWAVRGCLDWQRGGLAVPTSVRDATAEYRADQDRLRDFLDERCTSEPGAVTLFATLFGAYIAWAGDAHERFILSRQAFGTALAAHGLPAEKGTGGQAIRRGLAVRGDASDASGCSSTNPPHARAQGEFVKTGPLASTSSTDPADPELFS